MKRLYFCFKRHVTLIYGSLAGLRLTPVHTECHTDGKQLLTTSHVFFTSVLGDCHVSQCATASVVYSTKQHMYLGIHNISMYLGVRVIVSSGL